MEIRITVKPHRPLVKAWHPGLIHIWITEDPGLKECEQEAHSADLGTSPVAICTPLMGLPSFQIFASFWISLCFFSVPVARTTVLTLLWWAQPCQSGHSLDRRVHTGFPSQLPPQPGGSCLILLVYVYLLLACTLPLSPLQAFLCESL